MTAEIDPDLALDLAKATADAYSDATEELTEIVARRLRAGVSSPDGWAERKLAELQLLQRDARKVVDGLASRTPGLIRTAVSSAYGIGADRFAVATHTRAVDRLVAEATTRVVSTHGQILRSTVDGYRAVIAKASTLVTTGTFTTDQAIGRALDEFAKRGITGFTDSAGRQWRLDRYAEMATRTAVGRAQVAGTLDRLVEDGRDLVIVSDHAGSCKVCAPFEGKVLSISGSSTGKVADGNGDQVQVLMSVSSAQEAGLQHPNCRHNLTAFVPGVTIPATPAPAPTDGTERRRARNLEEEQRRLERRLEAARTGETPKRAAAGRKPPLKSPADLPDDDDFVTWGARADGIRAAARLPRIRDLIKAVSQPQVTDIAAYLGEPYGGGFTVSGVDVYLKSGELNLIGRVLKGGRPAGNFHRIIKESDDRLSAENALLMLNGDVRGQGFAGAFYERVENWYIANGVERITVHADIDVGGYAWARGGFDWDLGATPQHKRWTLETARHVSTQIRAEMTRRGEMTDEIAEVLNLVDTLDLGDPRFPTPRKLSEIGHKGGHDPDAPAKAAFHDRHWWGVKKLHP